MKIALVHRHLSPGGLGGGLARQYFELGHSLAALGCDVTFVTGEPAWSDRRCAVWSMPFAGCYADWRHRIVNALAEIRPQIAECSIWHAELADAVQANRAYGIVVRCDVCAANFGDCREAAIERSMLLNADAAVSSSHAVSRFIKRWVDVDTPVIHLGSPALKREPTQRNVATSDFLWVGRPTLIKGYDRLLELASVMTTSSFTAVVGPARNPVMNRLQPRNLQFISRLSDASFDRLQSQHRFCLCTARMEGFGLSIMESMTRGLVPAVTADSGGPRDYVVDGVSGIVFTSASDLRAKQTAYNYETLSQRARITARRFQWTRTAEMSLGVYEKVAVA